MKIYVDGSGYKKDSEDWDGQHSGFALYYHPEGKPVEAFAHIFDERFTNNEMEYLAVLKALTIANKGDEIVTDSQLVIGHLVHNWKIKASNLETLIRICKALYKTGKIKISWVRSEDNRAGKVLDELRNINRKLANERI